MKIRTPMPDFVFVPVRIALQTREEVEELLADLAPIVGANDTTIDLFNKLADVADRRGYDYPADVAN